MSRGMRIFSPHAFRAGTDMEPELFPMHAPDGRAFYLVTPAPNAHPSRRRYLYELIAGKDGKPPRIVVTHSYQQAKKFLNLRLAEAFARFLSAQHIQHEHEFWLTLEPPVYESGREKPCVIAEVEVRR